MNAKTLKAVWSANCAKGLRKAVPRFATSKTSRHAHQALLVVAGPQQKKIHLKLGVANYFLGHVRAAVDHLKQADGPLAAFWLGQAHVALGQARPYAEGEAANDTVDHYDAAVKAFDKAEKSGYAAQQVQLQRAGGLRLPRDGGEAKAILTKLKDAAAHNAEYYYQEGAIAEAEGDIPRAAK